MANALQGLAQYLSSAGPDYGSGLPGMQGGQMILPKPQISSPLHGPYAPGNSTPPNSAQSDMAGTDGAKQPRMGASPPHPMAQLAKYVATVNPGHYLRGRSG